MDSDSDKKNVLSTIEAMEADHEADEEPKLKKLKHSEKDFGDLIQTNFANRYSLLVDNTFKSDVKFVFDKENVEIYAHQIFLSISTPVFYDIFNDPSKNKYKIVITDITSEIFKELLYVIYSNKWNNLNEVNGFDIMYAANKYELIHLENNICDFFIEKTTNDNVCNYYENCLLFRNKLTKYVEEFIQKNTESIFNTQSFLLLKLENLKLILSMPALAIDEHDLFIQMIKWSKNVCAKNGITTATAENIRTSLNGAETLIRFPTMNMDNFAKCTNEIPLFLSKDEIAEILFSITAPQLYDLSLMKFSQIKRTRLYVKWDYDWNLNCGQCNENSERFQFMIDSQFEIKQLCIKEGYAYEKRAISIKNATTNEVLFHNKITYGSQTLETNSDAVYSKNTWYDITISYSYNPVYPDMCDEIDTKTINEKDHNITLQWKSTKNISIQTLSLSLIT